MHDSSVVLGTKALRRQPSGSKGAKRQEVKLQMQLLNSGMSSVVTVLGEGLGSQHFFQSNKDNSRQVVQ